MMTLFKRLHESTIKNDKRLIKYDEHVFPLFDVKVNNNWMTSCMNHQRSSSISLRISAYQFSIMPIRSSRCHNIQSPDTQRPRTKHFYSYVNELLTVLIAQRFTPSWKELNTVSFVIGQRTLSFFTPVTCATQSDPVLF